MDRIPALHRRINQLKNAPMLHGKIVSFTTVHHPPAGFGSEAYRIALIERTDGTRVMAQLTTEGLAPAIGAHVAPRMRRIRTLSNGLFVNDVKYEVVEKAPLHTLVMHAYVLALTGPSGVGKTTITRSLLKLASPVAEQVPILTTRAPKKGDSEPYVHVTEKEFDAMLERGEIISHTSMPSKTEVRRYGYRRADIEKIWDAKKIPIVVTEIHLLKGLVESLGRRSVLSCGLLPPGASKRHMLSALLHRLRSRDRETPEQIEERLKVAEADLSAFEQHPHLFDHMVVNDKLEVCLETIQELVKPV